MAEQQDPLEGNTGATKERIAELKQLNREGAQAKAMLQGLAGAFKNFDGDLKSAVKNNDLLAGAAKNLSTSYKSNIGLAKQLSGFTVSQLKDAKTRASFEKQVLKAQGEQASIASEINILETELTKLKQVGVQLEVDRSKANQKRTKAQLDLAAQEIETNKVKLAQGKEDTRLQELGAKAFAKRAGVLDQIKNLEAEIAAENKKGTLADKTKIGDLSKQLELRAKESEDLTRQIDDYPLRRAAAQEAILDAEILLETKQNDLKNARLQYKAAVELSEEVGNQIDLTEELIGTNEKAAVAIGKGLDNAKGLSKTIQEVNNATPKFIEAFQTFSKITASIPIVGTVLNQITGDISAAADMFKKLKAEGKSSLQAITKAGAGFIKLGLAAAATAFVDAAVKGFTRSSDVMVKLNKSVAGSMVNMSAQAGRVAAAAGKYTVPLEAAAQTIAGINESLGMSLDFTQETTDQAIKLANKYGVSVDAVAHIVKNSAANKKTMTETVDAVTAGVARFNEMNNVSISTKAIFEDIGKASATTLRGIGKQPGALAAAAAAARSLGMSMEDIRAASESTTDFQKSLTDEMTTEMMLGKQLNLNKLREAALTGDVTTQAEEMKRLVMENQGRIGNNVKLQEQFAATLGISRDQYNDIVKNQEAMSVLTSKSGAAEKANDKARKMTQGEIAAQIESTTGKLSSLTDKLSKFQEDISSGAANFASDILKGFEEEGFIGGITNIFEKAFDAVLDAFNGKFTGSKAGALLGALTVAGGAVVTIKTAKGLWDGAKSLLGLGTKKPTGSAMDPIHTVSGGTGDLVDSLTRKLRPRSVKSMKFTKGLSNIFGGKNTMVGRQLRNMAAMFGKRSSMFKQVFSGMSKTFTSGGSKLFSGLSSTFKTGGPKILSGLSNIFKGGGSKLFSGLGKVAGPLLGKVLAPLELAMGAFKGVNQVKDLTAEQKKEQGIREDMGTTEAGIIGALTGNANKGSIFSEKLGIEKGGAGDEALGIATSGARGAMTGAAIGSVIPVVGTAVGAVVGGAIGVVSEGFKVFSDPNSKLRKGLSEFATATYDKAAVIGNKIKEGAIMVGTKIKDFAVGVKNKAFAFASSVGEGISNFATSAKEKISGFASSVGEGISNFATSAKEKISGFASSVGEGISNFASTAGEKISNFASSVGEGIMSFANTAKDKAKAFAGAVGEKIGNIRGKIGEFLEANDGLVGGIRAAASGLASKASNWFGSKVQGLKDWWNNDTSKKATPEIKQDEIKKVTTPLMQMSKDQAKTFTTAINTALSKGADTTIKAMDSLGEVIEKPLMLGATAANAQMEELKKLKAEGDKQHKAEIMELKNQTALLYEYIMKPQKSVIKMNTFKVGQSLTRV